MLSKKIELPASDMAVAIDLAKEQLLEIRIDKLSCNEDCVARILYKDSYKGHQSLLCLMQGIHALELLRIKKAIPHLQLDLLKPKNKHYENKRI